MIIKQRNERFCRINPLGFIAALAALATLVGCGSDRDGGKPNQVLAPYVDLDRFMGKWYVQGFSPTFLDKNAVNATETYELREDGKIATTYTFRKKTPDGPSKTMQPLGWVFVNETKAEWRMRFFGVFVSAYYILYVDKDYQTTVVGHPDRKLAWVMSRSPSLEESEYETLVDELRKRDYDLSTFKRMSQTW